MEVLDVTEEEGELCYEVDFTFQGPENCMPASSHFFEIEMCSGIPDMEIQNVYAYGAIWKICGLPEFVPVCFSMRVGDCFDFQFGPFDLTNDRPLAPNECE